MSAETIVIFHVVFWFAVSLAVMNRLDAARFGWTRQRVMIVALLWPIAWSMMGVYLAFGAVLNTIGLVFPKKD